MKKELKSTNLASADLHARRRLTPADWSSLNIGEAAFDLLINDPPREYIPEIVKLLKESIVPEAKYDHFRQDGLHSITTLQRVN